MSWQTLQPRAKRSKADILGPVSLRVTEAGKRFAQRAVLLVRPDLAGGGFDWWRPDGYALVELGDGPDRGRLRVSAGDMQTKAHCWPIRQAGRLARNAGKPAVRLAIELPGLPSAGLAVRAVPFEVAGASLVITLPAELVRNVPEAPAPCETRPFRGYAAREGLPAQIGRRSRVAAL